MSEFAYYVMETGETLLPSTRSACRTRLSCRSTP